MGTTIGRLAWVVPLLGIVAAGPEPGPGAFIAALYAGYQSSADAASPLATEAAIKRTFSPPTAGLLLANARHAAQAQEVGCIETDPFVVGQGYQITGLKITAALDPANPRQATVTAAFHNFDAPRTVRYRLLRGPSGWQIDDLQSGPDGSFKAKLRRCLEVG